MNEEYRVYFASKKDDYYSYVSIDSSLGGAVMGLRPDGELSMVF